MGGKQQGKGQEEKEGKKLFPTTGPQPVFVCVHK